MKNLKFLLILILSITIWSCEDDDDDNIIVYPSESISQKATLNTPEATEFEITETTDSTTGNENELATTFTWSGVSGNYNGTVLYFLQIDVQGNNFTNAVFLPLTSEGTTEETLDVTNGDLNLAVNQINSYLTTSGSNLSIDFENGSVFDVRVLSKSSVSGSTTYSDPVTITVNAYEKIVVVEPELFLVGSIQSYYGISSWNPEQGIEMRYIGDGVTKVFEAYVKATAGDIFKFISNQAVWDNVAGNYGTIDGAQDGNLKNGSDSGNIEISEEGQYYVQVDIDNLTYKLVKMQWGIIGNATAGGWSDETPMSYDFQSNSWKIDATVTDGEVKFRSKVLSNAIFGDGEDWKYNVGANLTAWDEADGNFAVSAGSVSITLKIGFDGVAEVSGI